MPDIVRTALTLRHVAQAKAVRMLLWCGAMWREGLLVFTGR